LGLLSSNGIVCGTEGWWVGEEESDGMFFESRDLRGATRGRKGRKWKGVLGGIRQLL